MADAIRDWLDEGYRLDPIAVFYRVNSLSRGLELALRAREIPPWWRGSSSYNGAR